ncbi:MAG: cytochrome c [Myxococcaceae bacterium]|nr:cytochrome c [Myxococcaceae bacterium]
MHLTALARRKFDMGPRRRFRSPGTRIGALWAALTVLTALDASAGEPAADEGRPWARVVALLQYLGSDYPAAVASGDTFELDEQAQLMNEVMKSTEALGEKARAVLPRLRAVQQRVEQREDPAGVARDARALAEVLMAKVGLKAAPPHPPNVSKGESLFSQRCAACHGAGGKGDGPAAAGLKPAPADLTSQAVRAELTAYRVFNTVSFGVLNTPMPAFHDLSADERWDVAFYVLSLTHPKCDGLPVPTTLERLASKTDAQLAREHGPAALACLRKSVPEAVAVQAVRVAEQRVREALAAAQAGALERTREVLLDTYIFEIESVEPLMWSRDAELVRQIELQWASARAATGVGPAETAVELKKISALLVRARKVVESRLVTVTTR